MGLQKGPAYQRVLSQIFNAKLDGLATTKKDELRLAKTLIQQETEFLKILHQIKQVFKKPQTDINGHRIF